MTRIDIETTQGPAWADLTRPRNPRALAVLTHGAGGPVTTKDLLAINASLAAGGVAVALVTQPYVVAGRRTPPKTEPQDDAWLQLIAALRRRRGLKDLPLIVGGRSNGARLAARTATAAGASCCVALAFPVHPPGKPENSRLSELDAAGVPTLVVQGERDPFGMPPAERGRTVHVIAGAGHSLARFDEVAATVATFADEVLR